jgi:hypothetical protein
MTDIFPVCHQCGARIVFGEPHYIRVNNGTFAECVLCTDFITMALWDEDECGPRTKMLQHRAGGHC